MMVVLVIASLPNYSVHVTCHLTCSYSDVTHSFSMLVQLFSSTAAALPAEVGPDGKLVQPVSTPPFAFASKSVMAWRRRMAAQRSRRQQKKLADQQ